MDAGFKEWLNTVVQIQPYISQDGAGDPTFGTSFNLNCYSEGSSRLIVNAAGEEVLSTQVLYFDGSALIHLKDYITLGVLQYPILQAIPYLNERGVIEMVEVFL